ncbi:MAG TPA: phosphoglycerate kinase [Candidatus Saccharimonadales bacterium]|nr:phosphoglycerate kinase [Candidatus Saccharimonadales bacterium]
MLKLRTLKDLNLKNKRVLLSVDYNVPVSSGIVGDPLRIEASFETIKYLLKQNCSIVLMSHMGRPEGKPNPEMSLEPVAKKASQMLGRPIGFIKDCVGPEAEAAAKALQPGEIILLENTRFHKEEEANDPKFAKKLAGLADIYVDDAFANIHRAHASTVGVAEYLPSAAGCLVEKEVAHISRALQNPKHPLLAVIAGAKVSTKIEVLDNLLKYVDRLLIGGAMANTFLAALGHPIGKSKYEKDYMDEAKVIIVDAKRKGVELILPDDVVVADSLEKGPGKVIGIDEVKKSDYIVDLGPKTVARALNPIDFHGTVIWNGPLGITEVHEFAHHSRLLAENIIESGADCIIGGGDTAAFVDEAGLHDKFTWVSTGGGASLELMAGQELPGLKVLQK